MTTLQKPKLHSLWFAKSYAGVLNVHRRFADTARANTNRHRAPTLLARCHKTFYAQDVRASTNTASVQLFFANTGDGRQHCAELLHLR